MLSSFSSLASVGWPVLDRFRFGDAFAISPHGLGIAIGFMIGGWLLGRIGVRRGVTPEHISTMLFWALIGAILGSRIAYVIAHLSEFDSPLEWLYVWKGGISLLGGITGAIVINIPRMRKYGYRFFQVMDPAAVALALGIGIGRIGDLIIGDHLGKPTSWLARVDVPRRQPRPAVQLRERRLPGATAGGHLEEIQPVGRDAPRRQGAHPRDGRRRPPDGAVRHDPRVDPVRDPVEPLQEAAPRGRDHADVRPLLRMRPAAGGLAAHRQALRTVHGQPVDGADGGDDLGGHADLVGDRGASFDGAAGDHDEAAGDAGATTSARTANPKSDRRHLVARTRTRS